MKGIRLGEASFRPRNAGPRGPRRAGLFFISLVVLSLSIGAISAWEAVKWIGKPFPGFLVTRRMAVGLLGSPGWTGMRAGLRYPDRIIAADGRVVSSSSDLQAAVASVPEGTSVRYEVDRGNRIEGVVVPSMQFSAADLLGTYGVFLLLGLAYLAIGAVVHLLKPGQPVTRVFLLACVLESMSSFVAFNMESSHSIPIRAVFVGEVLLPAVVVHIATLFPERWDVTRKRPSYLVAPYGLAAALWAVLAILYPRPSALPFFTVMRAYLFAAVVLFVGSAAAAYVRKSSMIARQRAKVVLVGAAIALPLPALAPAISLLGETVGGRSIITNLTAIPALIFPVSIAYAIAKHNLFDVDVFIKRTVGYAIMTVVVGTAYLGLQVGLESVVLAPVFGAAARKVTPVIFAFLVVFLFNPLNRRVQAAVDRLFYREPFDYKETVLSVSGALSSVLDLKEIIGKVVHTARDAMFIDTSGLLLAGARNGAFRGHFVGDAARDDGGRKGAEGPGEGGGNGREREEAIPADDPVVALIARERRLITKYDVAEDPRFADVRETCGTRFDELGASLAVPLLHKGELRAVLTVGHKKSGRFFTREDVELLQTLASQGAVAIENARMAEQMRREEVVRTNLSRYLSPQIVDGIVKNDVQVNLGGARRVVTVLFSDIRNFTTITESRPPDQLVRILNEYFSAMAEVIFASGGSLDKYIGDAIVAVFGSLVPLEYPERSAAATAIGMMRRLDELNRRWEARDGFSMTMGIGIATGDVFLGNIGSPERMEFTVIGDTVNVASRFSSMARSGQILVTKAVASGLGPGFRRKELPPAQVKGKVEKLDVHEVLYSIRADVP